MCLESAAKVVSEISGNSRVSRVGKHSHKNSKKKDISKLDQKERSANCYFAV